MLKFFKRHKLTTVALIIGIVVAVFLGLARNTIDIDSAFSPTEAEPDASGEVVPDAMMPDMAIPDTAIVIVDEAVQSLEWGNIVDFIGNSVDSRDRCSLL